MHFELSGIAPSPLAFRALPGMAFRPANQPRACCQAGDIRDLLLGYEVFACMRMGNLLWFSPVFRGADSG